MEKHHKSWKNVHEFIRNRVIAVESLLKKILRKIDKIIFKRDRVNHKLLKIYQNNYHEKVKVRPERIKSISVIVPCYNHSKYLKDALNSILNQTRLPDEVILIDDNSTDSTLQVLQRFSEDYKKTINII